MRKSGSQIFEVRIRTPYDIISRHFHANDGKKAGEKGEEFGKVLSVRKVSADNKHMLGDIEKLKLNQDPRNRYESIITEPMTITEIVFGKNRKVLNQKDNKEV
jgi:hypothetical protein